MHVTGVGWAPYHWDGARLHYGGNRSARVDGAAIVFEVDGVEVARSELRLLNPGGQALPLNVTVETELPVNDHGAVLRVRAANGVGACTHEIHLDGSEWVQASLLLARNGNAAINSVAVKHTAALDNWSVSWVEETEGVLAGKRTVTPGAAGRGIHRPLPVAAGTKTPKVRHGRDFETDVPGGELTIEWSAEVAEAGISPDTYGPSETTTANCYECTAAHYESSYPGAVFAYHDDNDSTAGYQVGARWENVTCSGTINSAYVYTSRASSEYGSPDSGKTIGIRAEAANNPAAFSATPWTRSFRSAQVDHVIGAEATPYTWTVTSLIDDLVNTAGYTYDGSQAIHIAFGGNQRGWETNTVSWIAWAHTGSDTGTYGPRPRLEINYTPSATSVDMVVDVDLPALDVAVASAVGTVSATADVDLPALDVVTTATVGAVGAVVDVDLPALDVTVTGNTTVTAAADVDLPALDVAVAGESVVSGVVAADLPALDVAVAGSTEVAGAVAVDLPALDVAVAASSAVTGAVAVDLPALDVAVAGEPVVSAAANVDLPALDVAVAVNVVSDTVLAVVDVDLPALDVAATAEVGTISVAADIDLPALDVSAAAEVGAISVAADVDLPALDVAVAGGPVVSSTASVDLPALDVSAAGGPVVATTADVDLPALDVAVAGEVLGITRTAVVSVDLPALDVSVTGETAVAGAADVDLPALDVAVASAVGAVTGAADIDLPALSVTVVVVNLAPAETALAVLRTRIASESRRVRQGASARRVRLAAFGRRLEVR